MNPIIPNFLLTPFVMNYSPFLTSNHLNVLLLISHQCPPLPFLISIRIVIEPRQFPFTLAEAFHLQPLLLPGW